jgi:uncharacterized protein
LWRVVFFVGEHERMIRLNSLRAFATGSAVFALMAVFAVGCGGSTEADADVRGNWLGTLPLGGFQLRIVFNLTAPTAGGAYTGTVDAPEQGLIGDPLSRIDVMGRHVTLGIADIGASYIGDVAKDGKSIVGLLSQAAQFMPLTLVKQPGPVDYRRPQDPVAPYPYQSEDVSFASDAVTLAGTMTWPTGGGPFKTVVLISGSGPNTRDEAIVNHRPLLVLADALTRAGIATLRYDKRGVGASTGDYDAATSLDFAADARAAVQHLRAQTRFAVSTIGLVGHSEGGMLAPMAADGNADVAFLVLLAGPGVPGAEIIVSQQRAVDAANGTAAADLDAIEAVNRSLFACFTPTIGATELDACLRGALVAAGVADKPTQERTIAELDTPWMRFFASYDPVSVLRTTTIPVLALNGSLDLQVLPDLNLPPIRQALAAAGNTHATVEEPVGLNHLFQHATTGSPAEYGFIDETMSPEVLTEIASWIAAR